MLNEYPIYVICKKTNFRWVIVALLFFATTINYFDRFMMGILAPLLETEIGWTELEYGYIVSSFQFAYAIGTLLLGYMIDRLGTSWGFTNSYCTAPVCSPSRSAMITGFYQNYIGANQHRTEGPGFEKQPLPYGIKPITHLLEDAGYFTCLMETRKTDLNFTLNKPVYQGIDWSERAEGQPFFAQLTYGGTHRRWGRDPVNPIDIKDVELPPYYPQIDLAKRDWANGLESAQVVDRKIG